MDFSIWLNPVVTSALQWVVVGMLGCVSTYLLRVGKGIADTQRATKVLMREDLIGRWRLVCAAGYIDEEERREWVDDYALYLRLVGKNEYLEGVCEKVLDMPSGQS